MRTLLVPAMTALVVYLPLGTSPVHASATNLRLTITGISINQLSNSADGGPMSEVAVTATAKNIGTETISDDVQLVTGRPFTTRSAVAEVIKTHTVSGLTGTSAHALISNLPAGASTSLKLTLSTTELWGQSQQGVFPIGVRNQGGASSDVIATSWFGATQTLSPTRVTFAVPLTTNVHPVANADSSNRVQSESLRLMNLVTPQLSSVSYVLDPYATQLLAASSNQSVRSVATRLESLNSVPSIYAQTNLARLNAGNQSRAITRSLQLTPHTDAVVYLPKSDKTEIAPYGATIDLQIVPVVSNTYVAGDKLETLDASGSRPTGRALVYDEAISNCLVMKSAFEASWCLSSQLSMVTAESPNVSRSILLVSASQWNPSPDNLNAINEALTTNPAFTVVSLSDLMKRDAVTTVPASSTLVSFDPSLRKVEREVLKTQTNAHNVFGDIPEVVNLTSIAAQLYSQNWKSNVAAKHFGRTYVLGTHELLNGIHLEGSKHITIPGTRADLPITVFNSTKLAAKVIVNVDGQGSSRLTAHPSDIVTVEPGSRVTVQIPIQLNSSSSVLAEVQLSDSAGKTFGDRLTIEIASTAYQQFARSLVWLALIALVLLVGNNVWRRTRKSHAD